MAKVNLPKLNQTGANEWADVESNDVALREGVNSITNEQVAAGAAIDDSKLASPNNSAYRTLLSASGFLFEDKAAATYVLGSNAARSMIASGGNFMEASTAEPFPFFYFDDADYTVASKTQKLRIRAQVACNATKAAIKFTIGLYPITVAGGADALTITLGTVVSGSAVEINEPAASTISQANSGDFTIPADGAYAFGVVTSGTLTNNSVVLTNAVLQSRNT